MAALPNVKLTGKTTPAQERTAEIAHATQVAAAASLGQGPNVEAVLEEREQHDIERQKKHYPNHSGESEKTK